MIGLGSYAFFWQGSDRVSAPLTLTDQLRRTRELDVDLFQICDYAPLLELSGAERHEAKAVADELGLTIELGTKGIAPAHLASMLDLAAVFDAPLVRSMVHAPGSRPTLDEAAGMLRASIPAYEAAGVTLALETYEQLPSVDLVSLVEEVGSPRLGICLDPANTVAGLEHPRDVVALCAPHTVAIHAKDFAFRRRDGWVGFTLEGAAFGTGLLDYPHLLAAVDPAGRGVNQVVEHWLPWQGDEATTIRLENDWTAATLAAVRSST
ncbi:sugar phosphate isomerase/epimerase family protein [Leifsonia poae]|uniref:sugar phosphate isomerase/epimerase family protein n=1 Tax=Leifsonia poae TaxID=110933 RepID=UPI001CBECD3C|nr:TIM barrel protein [Leifsonia poae]